MNDLLTVGEVAKQVGVTPKTVRYYEKIGLLPPAKRGPNGYRYFRLNELNRLLFIQRAKSLGLTLSEIRELVIVAEDGHCTMTRTELGQILDDKIADCTRRIEALAAFRNQLESAARQVKETEGEVDEAYCPVCTAFAPTCGCIPDLPSERT
jgi:DNA-binding transcriptional MerR regulator